MPPDTETVGIDGLRQVWSLAHREPLVVVCVPARTSRIITREGLGFVVLLHLLSVQLFVTDRIDVVGYLVDEKAARLVY